MKRLVGLLRVIGMVGCDVSVGRLKTLWTEYDEAVVVMGSRQTTDDHLTGLQLQTNLQAILLGRTKITDAGVAELKKALPKCKIVK